MFFIEALLILIKVLKYCLHTYMKIELLTYIYICSVKNLYTNTPGLFDPMKGPVCRRIFKFNTAIKTWVFTRSYKKQMRHRLIGLRDCTALYGFHHIRSTIYVCDILTEVSRTSKRSVQVPLLFHTCVYNITYLYMYVCINAYWI